MAEEDKTPSEKDPSATPKGGKEAILADLAKERDKRQAAETALEALQKDSAKTAKRLKEIEDKDKSEVEKLREDLAAETKAREAAEMRAMRMEVALEKGLPDDSAKRLVSQAKRLQGGTREELEADADDFFSSIKPADTNDKAPTGKPKERLSGGGDPTEEPAADVRKVVEAIPRGVGGF